MSKNNDVDDKHIEPDLRNTGRGKEHELYLQEWIQNLHDGDSPRKRPALDCQIQQNV